jgi:hypothetical protein
MDVKGKGAVDGYRRLNPKAAAAAEVAKRDAELRAQYVVVPPGDEAKTISCPICKEVLKSEFLEDDEDWVWKNAVMKDDRVSVCFFDIFTTVTHRPRRCITLRVTRRPLCLQTVLLLVYALKLRTGVVLEPLRLIHYDQHLPGMQLHQL